MDTSDERPASAVKPAKQHNKKKWLLILLIVALIAAGAGAYWWRDKQAKSDQQKQQNEVTALKDEVSSLQKQLADEKQKSKKTEEKLAATKPSAEAIANIKASISSGNTAALEGYMASSVNVILAASEGIGLRTPVQAIGDLQYLDSATDPWDFDLPAATLSAYGSGDYAQYFPSGAVVGKSANNYVISFTFNSSGKISGIFISPDAGLL
jgi:cytoskeletal protein RodZ